jgi:hypothetical protein
MSEHNLDDKTVAALTCITEENDVYYEECIEQSKIYDVDEARLKGESLGAFWEGVRYLAQSDLPNDYFLRQFSITVDTKPFTQKEYWHGFAAVLAYRGIEKLDDVKEKIFIWFQDPNWPGAFVIQSFVSKHKDALKDTFVNVIWQAFDEGDIGWFWCLMYTFIQLYELKNPELDILVDEIWHKDGLHWNEYKPTLESALLRLFPKNQAQQSLTESI